MMYDNNFFRVYEMASRKTTESWIVSSTKGIISGFLGANLPDCNGVCEAEDEIFTSCANLISNILKKALSGKKEKVVLYYLVTMAKSGNIEEEYKDNIERVSEAGRPNFNRYCEILQESVRDYTKKYLFDHLPLLNKRSESYENDLEKVYIDCGHELAKLMYQGADYSFFGHNVLAELDW